MEKILRKLDKPCWASPLLLLTLIIIIWLAAPANLFGQEYLGIGFHLTPPVYLENTQNPYVVAKPQVGLAGSLTYKKEWAVRKRQKWYLETGLTIQSLRYHQTNYFADSSIWSDFPNNHFGYPSVLIGGGHSFALGRTKGEFAIGLETSLLLAQTLDGMESASFGIVNDPVRDATFPLYLRLNLAYNHNLKLFRSVLGQLQIYTNLSAQKLTKGAQYIRNVPQGGPFVEGSYYVNNSEFGIKLFTNLSQKAEKTPSATATQNALLADREKYVKYRISLVGQFYAPPKTVYLIPQVDSFSIKPRNLIAVPQIGIVLEIPHRRNGLWSTVIGLGVGLSSATMVFTSDGRFPSQKMPVQFSNDLFLGGYGIANLGLSRRHTRNNLTISHTLSGSFVVPFRQKDVYLGFPENIEDLQGVQPYENPIIDGWAGFRYESIPGLFGIEYNPEIILTPKKSVFVAFGLVGNWTAGLLSQGTFQVTNNKSTYYGDLHQGFSKIGVSMRVGFAR